MITSPSPESLRTDPSESLKVAGSNKGWYEIGAGSANEQVARLAGEYWRVAPGSGGCGCGCGSRTRREVGRTRSVEMILARRKAGYYARNIYMTRAVRGQVLSICGLTPELECRLVN